MATPKKSLASRAGSAVRRAVRRGAPTAEPGSAESTAAEKAASTPAKKSAAKKSAAKKSAAKKSAAKKSTAKKSTAKKSTASKTAAKKTAPAKKTTAKKTAPAKKTTAKATAGASAPAPAKKSAAKKAAATKSTPAKKTATKTAKKTSAKTTARGAGPAALVVREGEDPWTSAELGEVRQHLEEDVTRLSAELEDADSGLHDLMVDSGDGSGHDQADVGSSSFERDHELSIANNARDMLDQTRHALERIEDGSYGVCERNGEPIGKLRLMAFPRATLCMSCKQREERR